MVPLQYVPVSTVIEDITHKHSFSVKLALLEDAISALECPIQALDTNLGCNSDIPGGQCPSKLGHS